MKYSAPNAAPAPARIEMKYSGYEYDGCFAVPRRQRSPSLQWRYAQLAHVGACLARVLHSCVCGSVARSGC
eukprot:scaffold106487_cov37-Tisochrysis_lutea.AAC.3